MSRAAPAALSDFETSGGLTTFLSFSLVAESETLAAVPSRSCEVLA
jgi:hypothetical protein